MDEYALSKDLIMDLLINHGDSERDMQLREECEGDFVIMINGCLNTGSVRIEYFSSYVYFLELKLVGKLHIFCIVQLSTQCLVLLMNFRSDTAYATV